MTYYCVLNACKKAGQLHLVLELFQQMPSADVVSYNSVIAACDYTGQWQTLCLKELGRWVRDFHGIKLRCKDWAYSGHDVSTMRLRHCLVWR